MEVLHTVDAVDPNDLTHISPLVAVECTQEGKITACSSHITYLTTLTHTQKIHGGKMRNASFFNPLKARFLPSLQLKLRVASAD